jgi:hypothetical protein
VREELEELHPAKANHLLLNPAADYQERLQVFGEVVGWAIAAAGRHVFADFVSSAAE